MFWNLYSFAMIIVLAFLCGWLLAYCMGRLNLPRRPTERFFTGLVWLSIGLVLFFAKTKNVDLSTVIAVCAGIGFVLAWSSSCACVKSLPKWTMSTFRRLWQRLFRTAPSTRGCRTRSRMTIGRGTTSTSPSEHLRPNPGAQRSRLSFTGRRAFSFIHSLVSPVDALVYSRV